MVAVVLVLTAFMWGYEVESTVLLHLYYVPVVITGFLLGQYRARVMSLLCILTATIIFMPSLEHGTSQDIPLLTVFAFLLWGATLFSIGLMVGILSDRWHSALQKIKESHEKDVLTDELTGVANRRAFDYELERRYAEWERCQEKLCMIILDIDYFKSFNDRYGHQAGDAVLSAVAKGLEKTVRNVDLVARYGGEEFAVVLPGTGIELAKEVAERVRKYVESARFPYNGLKLRLTVSVGVAELMENEDLEDFVQRSDAALYCSKEMGRNCVHFHDGTESQLSGNGVARTLAVSLSDHKPACDITDAYTDNTTGLPTQKVFLEELGRRSAESTRYGGKLSVALVRIDDYQDTNEDDVSLRKSLVTIVARLASTVLRESDLIARYDKSTFCIMLPGTSLRQALVPLERLNKNSVEYSDPKHPRLSYAVSTGLTELEPGESPGSILQRLESSVSQATDSGGHCICVHDGMKHEITKSSEIVAK